MKRAGPCHLIIQKQRGTVSLFVFILLFGLLAGCTASEDESMSSAPGVYADENRPFYNTAVHTQNLHPCRTSMDTPRSKSGL